MQANMYSKIFNLVMKSAKSLDDDLADLLFDGGKSVIPKEIKIFDIHNFNGFCGYNYWLDDELIAQFQYATLGNGNIVLYRKTFKDEELNERYDYYSNTGSFIESSTELHTSTFYYENIMMEPNAPILNHLYNILSHQYDYIEEGIGNSPLVQLCEKYLRKAYKSEWIRLSAQDKQNDEAIKIFYQSVAQTEMDPVLKWTERQIVFKSFLEKAQKIMKVKKRVHKFNFLNYDLVIKAATLLSLANRIKKRPLSNLRGLAYRYTIGLVIWFLSTVKSNLGYSIALAIYGPFTFYFITQPMNPHAMWMVGKVRNAYIDTVNSVENYFDEVKPAQLMDQVKVAAAAPIKNQKGRSNEWLERMSQFKAMQIGYEGSLIQAVRLGRLEYIENQLTFPMMAENAWNEVKRYEDAINGSLQFNKNLKASLRKHLNEELILVNQLKVYTWEKMIRFVMDHPYIVLDKNNEQKEKNYYSGKSFIFIKEMTDELQASKKIKQLPKIYAEIQRTAEMYDAAKIRTGNIITNLEKNSKLFAQDDLYDTTKLRSYMQRHWETLFLQQNKKQEASSFGLQAYTWSVRNTLWVVQSIFSAKRTELPNMIYKHNLDNQNTHKIKGDKSISNMYETMMHLLVMEFVGIKKEIAETIQNDDEVLKRKEIISGLKNSINTRDKLMNTTTKVALTL